MLKGDSPFDRLLLAAPPPEGRASPTASAWASVQDRLGTDLPTDYRRFIDTYGFVRLDDILMVYDPFAPAGPGNLVDQVMFDSEALGVSWPDDGVLPVGRSDNGDVVTWVCHGEPDSWTVAIWPEDGREPEALGLGLAALLDGLCSGDVIVDAFPERFPRSAVFVPVT